jgi:hypothetical protein
MNFDGQGGVEYIDPSGNIVATSTEIWEGVVVPTVLSDYTEKKRNELDHTIQHSLIVGFDYYLYTKKLWLHSWGNLMPYHYDAGDEFSYHKYNNGEQWYDYSGGLIFGWKLDKHLGVFVEGKYNKSCHSLFQYLLYLPSTNTPKCLSNFHPKINPPE